MSYNHKHDFLTVQEVSELLRLSVLTIYKYIKSGELKAVEFGGHYRIGKTSLSNFIGDHVVNRKKSF